MPVKTGVFDNGASAADLTAYDARTAIGRPGDVRGHEEGAADGAARPGGRGRGVVTAWMQADGSGRAQCRAVSMSIGTRLPSFTGTPIEKTDANTRAVFGDTFFIHGERTLSGW